MTTDKITITRKEFFSKLNSLPVSSYKVDSSSSFNYFILGDYKYCLKTEWIYKKTELIPSIQDTFWKIKKDKVYL